jgi:HD-GYP domain-containing protein (c-di-GMP phosphodiesterase class II)
MMRHPAEGERLIGDSPMFELERCVARGHHERWDGSGYPDGLRCEQIPLEARIVSACDAFNAMTTTRSYRRAMPLEDALAELRRNSGTQFDPDVVDALLEIAAA